MFPLSVVSTDKPRNDGQEWRFLRYRRRQESARILTAWARAEAGLDPDDMTPRASDPDWVRPPRPARCRWALGGAVGVHAGESGAHFSGVERCGSVWACPVCSSVVRNQRANEIQQAVENWQVQGGKVVFVTLTIRHQEGDGLALTLDAVMAGWRKLLQGRQWQTFRDRFGIRGTIRAIEVTRSAENGWHPHAHALFFVDKSLSPADLAEWESVMFTRWANHVTTLGARLPTRLRGIDVRLADDEGKVLAQYLAKVQDAASKPLKTEAVGQEMARFDFKAGRKNSMMPFEFLDQCEDLTDSERGRLWVEFFEATRGRQAITWSKGLRALLLPDADDELTDEEVLDSVTVEPLVILVPSEIYRRHLQNQPAVACAVLDALERGETDTALTLSGGIFAGGELQNTG